MALFLARTWSGQRNNTQRLRVENLSNISTDDGTSIVVKTLSANADFSIRRNFECDSNVTDVGDLQTEKMSLCNQ
jgi:hypothetical protein